MIKKLSIISGCALLVLALTGVTAPPGSALSATRVAPVVASGGLFVATDPHRLMDTRSKLGGPGSVIPGGTVTVGFAGRSPVAAGASALSYNLTVVNPTSSGSLSVYPAGTPFTGVVSMTYPAASLTRPLTTQLGSAGGLTFRNNGKAKIDLVVDVLGYYTGGAATTGGAFTALAGVRSYDSRPLAGVAAGRMTTVAVAGHNGLPTAISAVVANLTVLTPAAAGSLSLYPDTFDGQVDGYFTAGRTQEQLQTVTLSAGGTFTLRNNGSATIQVVVDVLGYYRAGPAITTGAFTPLASDREWDSRTGQPTGPITNALVNLPRYGSRLPVSGVQSVIGNLTVLDPASSSSLAVNSADGTSAGIPAVNYTSHVTTAAAFPLKLALDQAIAVHNNAVTGITVVLDLQGWFLGEPNPLVAGTTVRPEHDVGFLTGVSCPSDTFCLAIAAFGDSFTYNGSRWGAATPIPGIARANGVACVSATFCVVTGAAASSTQTTPMAGLAVWDGTSWSTSTVPGELDRVACASTQLCVAAAFYTKNSAVWRGSSWQPLPPPIQMETMACSAAGFCLIADETDVYRLSGGVWGLPLAIPDSAGGVSVSCTPGGTCEFGLHDGKILGLRDGTWRTEYSGAGFIYTVKCWSDTGCYAIDSEHAQLEWDGTTWAVTSPALPDDVLSLSCSSRSACIGWGNSERTMPVYRLSAAGWSPVQRLSWSQGELLRPDCASATFCVVTDGGGGAVTWDGTSWSAPRLIDADYRPVTTLSCPTNSFCAGGDSGQGVVLFDGASWSSPAPVAHFRLLSCASARFCVGISDARHAWVFNGTGWRDAGPDPDVTALDCPSEGFCLAGGMVSGPPAYGTVFTFDGQVWLPVPDSQVDFVGDISCASVTYCLVLGSGVGGPNNRRLGAAIWNGVTVRAFARPSNGLSAEPSCPAVDRCYGVGLSGFVYGWDGVGWTAPAVGISPTVNGSDGYRLSCPAVDFCVESDSTRLAVLRAADQLAARGRA